MDLYSMKHLVRARLLLKWELELVEWRKKKRFLFGLITESEGFYFKGTSWKAGKEYVEHAFVENDKVYEKPQVVLYFTRNKKEIYFETEKEAQDYYDSLKVPGSMVEL